MRTVFGVVKNVAVAQSLAVDLLVAGCSADCIYFITDSQVNPSFCHAADGPALIPFMCQQRLKIWIVSESENDDMSGTKRYQRIQRLFRHVDSEISRYVTTVCDRVGLQQRTIGITGLVADKNQARNQLACIMNYALSSIWILDNPVARSKGSFVLEKLVSD